MKMIRILTVFAILTCLASCQQIEEKHYEIHAEVVDESGHPLEGVQVSTGRLEVIAHAPVPSAKSVVMKPFLTNPQGIAILKFTSAPDPDGNINFYRNGYYWTSEQFTWIMPDGYKGKNRTAQVKAILKPIKNPIPMYATSIEKAANIPELNTEYGYDLMLGQALPPLGDGKIADFTFRVEGFYDNVHSFDLKLKIEFPDPHDGVIEFKTPQRLEMRELHTKGSQLLSDYFAPENGYISSIVRTVKRANGKPGRDDNFHRNFYFRTRTKVSPDGKIISAHYGKIYGDFHLSGANKEWGYIASLILVTTYFNPTPNDRNVEFDLKRNLNPAGNVQKP